MHLRPNNLIHIIVLVIIASGLYFYKLDQIPNGLYVDEAVTGFNAYSLLKTGKDEYGKILPIAMRFFGSYSPPLYTYLTIIPISIFGLTVFATRFISALSAVLMVLVFYLFLKELNLKNQNCVFLGTLFFVIVPWNVFFARVGYEVYLGFMLFSLAALLFLKSLSNSRFSIWAILALSFSTYAAHTEVYLFSLLLISLLIFRVKIFKNKAVYLTQLPNLYLLITPAFWNKASLFHKNIFFNYLAYFSPFNLFYAGDPDLQRSLPQLSAFYSWLLIPFLIGLFYLVKKFRLKKHKFIAILLLLSPIPASLGVDNFSTQRALPLLLPMSAIIVVGLDRLITKTKLFVLPVLLFLFVFSLLLLWRSYFVFLPSEHAKYWGYGFKELSQVVKENPEDNFIIDTGRTKPAYIELAFFLKLDPEAFHSAANQAIKKNYYTNAPFDPHYQLLNVETRAIDWQKDIYKDFVLVGDGLAFSEVQVEEHFLAKSFEIKDPLGEIVFVGYKTNPAQKCEDTKNQSILCQ